MRKELIYLFYCYVEGRLDGEVESWNNNGRCTTSWKKLFVPTISCNIDCSVIGFLMPNPV